MTSGPNMAYLFWLLSLSMSTRWHAASLLIKKIIGKQTNHRSLVY